MWSASCRHLHVHVRGREEGGLRGLFADPENAGVPGGDAAARRAGTPVGRVPDEESRRDDDRRPRPQPHPLPAQRQLHRTHDQAQPQENAHRSVYLVLPSFT